MKVLAVNMCGSSLTTLMKENPDLDAIYRVGIHRENLEKVIDFGRTLRVPRMGILAYAGRIRELFDRGGYDLIHASGWNGGLPALLSLRPFGLHFQGTDLREWRPGRGVKGFAKDVLQKTALDAAQYVTTSTPDLEEIAKNYREDARYVPNAVDLEDFSPFGEVHDHHKIKSIVRTPRKVAFSAGRMDHTKGIEIVHGALGRCLWLHGVQLDWGQEPTYSTAKKNAPSNLSFYPIVDHREIAKHYRGVDILLGQAKLGIVGMCELEASACGVPVVTYSRYGFPGLRHPPTVAEYADMLAAVSIYGDKRREIAESQRSYVVEHHAPAKVAETWKTIWEEAGERFKRR